MPLRDMWNTFRTSVRNCVEFLWFSYSTATPQNGSQIFTLLLFCIAISTGTGALLFSWLNELLKYEDEAAAVIAAVYAVAVVVLSFLVHPLRCVFTLMFPTLSTRQGRKLILSMCAMIVALHVLPNIAFNITTITRLLKCTSENLAHSLLNSSDVCNSIKRGMISRVQTIESKQLNFVNLLRTFDHSTDINVVMLRERLSTLSEALEKDFSKAKAQLEEAKLLGSRIFAAVFVLYLLMESSMYLKSYLTSVRFDNVYVTGLFRRTAANRGIHVDVNNMKNIIDSTSFRMTKKELNKCLIPTLLITLYLLLTVILILLDRIVHYLLLRGGLWLLDIPSTDITIHVDFKVQYLSTLNELNEFFGNQQAGTKQLIDLNKAYHVSVSSDASLCQARLSELDPAVIVSLGLLYTLAYCLTILQAYGQRLRRKVASSFFPQQEEERIAFLIEKMLAKESRRQRSSADVEPKSVESNK